MAFGDPYVTRAEMKSRLQIDDNRDDVRIDGAIEGARVETEDYCKRQFNTANTVSTRRFEIRPNTDTAVIDDFHTTTGLVVRVGSVSGGFNDTWTIDTDFIVTPINATRNETPGGVYWRIEALLNQRFPYSHREANLEVDANWGWAAVPGNVVEANYILAARLYRRRDSPDGIVGGFDGEPIRVGWRMDPDAEALLKKYRKHVPGMF